MRRSASGPRGALPVPAAAAGALALACAAALASPASGQELTLELAAGAAVGNLTEAEAGLELVPGPALGAIVDVGVAPGLAAYLGYTRSSFGCEEGFCAGRDATVTSHGAVAGARWGRGLPWARAGLALQSARVDALGSEEGGRDFGLGFEAAAGVELEVAGVRVRPGVRWLRHDASTAQGDAHVTVLELAVGIAFGVGSIP